MDKDVVISVKNVSKYFKVYFDKGTLLKERLLFWKRNHYEKRQVLNNISFNIHKGETVGLIGRNGSGKSTMLKMLTGIYYPNGGNIETVGRISSLIELGAGFHPDMSGRDNIYTNASIFGLSRKEIDSRLEDIIEFSELREFIDNPVRTYSSGMYMRLAFSVAINVNADILLIDEILAVGDANFQQKCYAKLNDLKAKGITIVIVTHDSNVIQNFCDRAIWIADGHVQYDGKSTDAVDRYLEYMSNENKKQLLEVENNEKVTKTDNVDSNHFGLYPNEITSAYMLNSEGKKTWIQETGKPCKLIFEYELKHESEYGYVFGIGFSDHEGRVLFGTNTQIDEIDLKMKKSHKGKIVFNIESLPLQKGEYGVNVSIVDKVGKPLDFYRNYHSMMVVTPKKEAGEIIIKHSWEFIDEN